MDRRLLEDPFDQCYSSVDENSCPTFEPYPRSPPWYSHKLNSAGLRYEVAVSIRLAKIDALNGTLPARSCSNLRIFRQGLKSNSCSDEFVIADRSYPDSRCLQPLGEAHAKHRLYQKISAGREVVNKCLKLFRVLTTTFRLDTFIHDTCFLAMDNFTAFLFRENLTSNCLEKTVFHCTLLCSSEFPLQ